MRRSPSPTGAGRGKQPITFSYQWLRCNTSGDGCNDISGANKQTYGLFGNGPEQPTGADGWATFTLSPTFRLQLRRGGAMVFFVRARKPGENLLGGVSTRPLEVKSTNCRELAFR